VILRAGGVEVNVAYGTSKKLDRIVAGEFAMRKFDNSAAYVLAGLSYDTKFNLGEMVDVLWDERFFEVAPDARWGQTPKLGSLHSCMMKTAGSAYRAVRKLK